MGKYPKLIEKILLGESDKNIDFDQLVHLLNRLGFEQRIKGSHYNFSKDGIIEQINL